MEICNDPHALVSMGENNCWALMEALLSFFQCSLWLNPQWDIFRSRVLFSQQTKTKDETKKKNITKSKHEGHWNVFFGLIISALLVTRQYPHDLFSWSNWFSVKLHYHSHSKTAKKLNHMCWGKIHIYYNSASLHSQCCVCTGQSQLSLGRALACNISICDLCWLHVSTCSYHPPPPICLAATLYSYWSVHLLACVPEMNTRLNAPIWRLLCGQQRAKVQAGMNKIEMKWIFKTNVMSGQCLWVFQHRGSCMFRMYNESLLFLFFRIRIGNVLQTGKFVCPHLFTSQNINAMQRH